MKAKVEYSIVPNLSDRLGSLRKLAYNLCFSWKSEIRDLFQRIDPGLWSVCRHNPVLMLGLVSQERLDELSEDQGFLAQLERIDHDFERYMSQPRIHSEDYSPDFPIQIAYFSAEFGLAACLPVYSGGLGILSGDHLKSASDLNVPLVGVGLLYQEGYFSQYLSSDGWQMETYPLNDIANMPVTQVLAPDGKPMQVLVKFKGEPVHIAVWRVAVGRISLYLLDTNVQENPPEFRGTTAQLYGGDRDMRLRQEIVLGIGGIRALKALGIEPTVIHMNEGHSSFSALERINVLRKEKGLSFDAAREIVIATTVFTTHTPVPAGNDTFDPALVKTYFEQYATELGINFRVLLGYGRLDPRDEAEPFGMTTLALRLSAHVNGVSKLHGEVSRAMWHKIWHRHPVEDVPIDHITNGVHVPTWSSGDMAALFNSYLGPNWSEDPDNERIWEQVEQIPASELWRAHERRREHLVSYARYRLGRQLTRRGASNEEVRAAAEVLSPEVLTIGFARRFATYKRATLLFKDPERLDRIVNHPQHPVQVIISGKAHPMDTEGKDFIKRIVHLARQERFRRRIIFLEDYNIDVALRLVAGADIWLNTPRRPLEACGTSGMKALANGCLNLSVLDGWWDEGYHRDFGWAIGRGEVYQNHDAQDTIESQDLYNCLEKEIVPLFYRRGQADIPREWVEKMKAGLSRLVPIFNTHRMVQEYMNRYYIPSAKRFDTLCRDNFAGALSLSAWVQKIRTGWHEVAVQEILPDNVRERPVGDRVEVTARIKLGSMSPEDVTVDAYYGRMDPNGNFVERDTIPLEAVESTDGLYLYRGYVPCKKTGRFGYTVRVMPSQQRLENRFIMGLVTWA